MRALLAIALLLGSSACARESLTAPSPPPPAVADATLALTVRVLEARTEQAIPGANVFVDERDVGRTAANGMLTTVTVPGREVAVHATADGYQPSIIVAATPSDGERWTFFLESR